MYISTLTMFNMFRKKSRGYKGTGDVFTLEDDDEEEGSR